jgi:hypothetical protein
MTGDLRPAYGGPDVFGQLAASDPYQRRARRLFERGQVAAVNGNEADVRVGTDASGGALELKGVPIGSGYLPQVGDWVSIQYEAGHSAAPWVVGPSMADDASSDPVGIGVFAVVNSAPADPQKSVIYFDDTLDTWRGWDGTQWVDFFAKLHNTLPDLQGGTASEYYHFSHSAHDSLARWLGAAGYAGGLGDGYVQRLRFSAIDASATARTKLFEKNGDFFWAINAEYDAANDRWNRVDAGKYAYLVGLYSKNGIPHEPGSLGGVAWWRATPGSNPVGDYTAIGGWELGFMMTEHRNFVMGGMNAELDGAGSPPYGRFSQSGHEDPDNFTGILRNVWYEGNTLHSPKVAGEGSWGRDTTDHPGWFTGIVDDIGFVWRYKAAGAGAFATAAWTELARLSSAGALSLAGKALTLSGNLTVEAASLLNQDLTTDATAQLAKLGVGKAWATGVLDVNGIINIAAANGRIQAYGGSGYLDIYNGATGDVTLWTNYTYGNIHFGAGNAERLKITWDGAVTVLGTFVGEYQTQTGAWAAPSGGANGRIVTLYNSTQNAHRLYVYSNGAWRYVGLA